MSGDVSISPVNDNAAAEARKDQAAAAQQRAAEAAANKPQEPNTTQTGAPKLDQQAFFSSMAFGVSPLNHLNALTLTSLPVSPEPRAQSSSGLWGAIKGASSLIDEGMNPAALDAAKDAASSLIMQGTFNDIKNQGALSTEEQKLKFSEFLSNSSSLTDPAQRDAFSAILADLPDDKSAIALTEQVLAARSKEGIDASGKNAQTLALISNHLQESRQGDLNPETQKRHQGLVADLMASSGIDKGIADVVAPLLDHIPSDQKANTLDVAHRLFDAQPEQLDALLDGKQDEALKALKIDPAQFDQAKEALVDGGLSYLQEKGGLTQSDVDSMKKLYKLNEALNGADGKLDSKDIMSLSASLTANDLDTLQKATNLVGDTLMTAVTGEVSKQVADAKMSPEYQNGLRQYNQGLRDYSNGAAKLRTPIIGPLLGIFGGYQKLAEGGARLRAGAYRLGEPERQGNAAIQQIRNNLNDNFPDLARAMTALETRDKLRESGQFQADVKAPTAEEKQAALKFYEGLKTKSLAELSQKDATTQRSLLDDAEKHFMNLDRTGLEAQIKSSLAATRDISGSTKDTLDQVNRVLSLRANQDLRDGITRESLEMAKNAKGFTESLLNKALAATDLTKNADGIQYKLGFDQASAIMSKATSGELPLDQLSATIKDAAIKGGERIFTFGNSLTQTTVSDFVKKGLVSEAQLQHKPNQESFSAYQLNGKTYLGYKAPDGKMAYIDQSASGTNKNFYMDPSHQKSYDSSLAQSSANKAPIQFDLADLQKKDYTESLTGLYMDKGADKEQVQAFVQRNNAAAFRVNGNDYLGYLTSDNKLAYIDSNKKTAYITDEATKAAYYGALQRDGLIDQALTKTQAFNSVDTKSSGNLQHIANQVATRSLPASGFSGNYQPGQQYSQPVQQNSHRQKMRNMSNTGKYR